MQSECHNATSHNLRVPTENHTDLCANHHAKHDARRFAGIFPQEAPEAISVDCGDVAHEEQNDSDDLSRLDLVAALDRDTCTTQATSVVSVDQSSNLSASQQIIACYRAIHGSGHAPEFVPTNVGEKELPQIPDDQRSMYTLSTPTDTQSAMDMAWRPKPKIHMRRSDQRALMQAQSQAIAMMHNAGLKPTNKIQCRRRGCADILPDVEALKYHIHIHNIADSASMYSDSVPSAAREPSMPECSTSNSKSPKRNHLHYLGTQRKRTTTSPLPRKPSAGSLLPSLFSPRETTPDAPRVPTLTTVAKAITPDLNPNKLGGLLPARNDETPSTHASTPSRGRIRKEDMAVCVGIECTPSIGMLLSPPSSPVMRGRLAPHAKSAPMPIALGPVTDNERSRSPVRALSPARAMSPIRSGIKRILSIGCPDNVVDK